MNHGPAEDDFSAWAEGSFLEMNVCKTMEIITTVRKKEKSPPSSACSYPWAKLLTLLHRTSIWGQEVMTTVEANTEKN